MVRSGRRREAIADADGARMPAGGRIVSGGRRVPAARVERVRVADARPPALSRPRESGPADCPDHRPACLPTTPAVLF